MAAAGMDQASAAEMLIEAGLDDEKMQVGPNEFSTLSEQLLERKLRRLRSALEGRVG